MKDTVERDPNEGQEKGHDNTVIDTDSKPLKNRRYYRVDYNNNIVCFCSNISGNILRQQ